MSLVSLPGNREAGTDCDDTYLQRLTTRKLACSAPTASLFHKRLTELKMRSAAIITSVGHATCDVI